MLPKEKKVCLLSQIIFVTRVCIYCGYAGNIIPGCDDLLNNKIDISLMYACVDMCDSNFNHMFISVNECVQ